MKAWTDNTLTDCECEQASQHYEASLGLGHGALTADEVVVLAVFDDTPHNKPGMTLMPKTFDSGKLRRFDVSLARTTYTSRATFDERVVAGRSSELVGVACAETKVLQSIPYVLETSQPPIKGRGVCVVDKVLAGEHNGHAALGWSASQRELTDKQKERAGEVVKNNLVQAFGRIKPVADVGWMTA